DRDPREMHALLENASITIGRLSYVCALQVAPHLQKICEKWLTYLAPLRENQEKEHAFKGLALVIQANPLAIWQAGAFPHLAAAIASWTQPSEELNAVFRSIMQSYKMSLGPQWPLTFSQCSAEVQQAMTARYGV